ncbi:unnamed protein product, partial [Iphiclides podalirius]
MQCNDRRFVSRHRPRSRGATAAVGRRSDRKRLTHTPRAPAFLSPRYTSTPTAYMLYTATNHPIVTPGLASAALALRANADRSAGRGGSTNTGCSPIPHYSIVYQNRSPDRDSFPPLGRPF